jgi:4'-phosphopantetheinyl transferase
MVHVLRRIDVCTVGQWSNPPAELHLDETNVDVWRASLDCKAAVLRRLEVSLAENERSRAARFRFERDRDRFIAARGILRAILGAYLQRHPADVTFVYGPHGKPALPSGKLERSIHFNLSHSYGMAMYAFAQEREIGVDLEKIRPEVTGEDIAERFLSARELGELRSLPAGEQVEGFFLHWTRKEAYLKALGFGMGIPLDSVDVSLAPGRPKEPRSPDSSRWKLRSIQPMNGYVGAVVAEGKGWGLRLWNWVS